MRWRTGQITVGTQSRFEPRFTYLAQIMST